MVNLMPLDRSADRSETRRMASASSSRPDDQPSGVVLGDDRLVIRELALDDPGDERPGADPEEEVVLVEVELDRLVVELPESRPASSWPR